MIIFPHSTHIQLCMMSLGSSLIANFLHISDISRSIVAYVFCNQNDYIHNTLLCCILVMSLLLRHINSNIITCFVAILKLEIDRYIGRYLGFTNISASIGVDKTLLYSSRIQTTCARKHNKASQDSYLTTTLADAVS